MGKKSRRKQRGGIAPNALQRGTSSVSHRASPDPPAVAASESSFSVSSPSHSQNGDLGLATDQPSSSFAARHAKIVWFHLENSFRSPQHFRRTGGGDSNDFSLELTLERARHIYEHDRGGECSRLRWTDRADWPELEWEKLAGIEGIFRELLTVTFPEEHRNSVDKELLESYFAEDEAKLERALVQCCYELGDPLQNCSECKGHSLGRKMKSCSACKTEWYCSIECQSAHWSKGGHKEKCKSIRKKQQSNKSDDRKDRFTSAPKKLTSATFLTPEQVKSVVDHLYVRGGSMTRSRTKNYKLGNMRTMFLMSVMGIGAPTIKELCTAKASELNVADIFYLRYFRPMTLKLELDNSSSFTKVVFLPVKKEDFEFEVLFSIAEMLVTQKSGNSNLLFTTLADSTSVIPLDPPAVTKDMISVIRKVTGIDPEPSLDAFLRETNRRITPTYFGVPEELCMSRAAILEALLCLNDPSS